MFVLTENFFRPYNKTTQNHIFIYIGGPFLKPRRAKQTNKKRIELL